MCCAQFAITWVSVAGDSSPLGCDSVSFCEYIPVIWRHYYPWNMRNCNPVLQLDFPGDTNLQPHHCETLRFIICSCSSSVTQWKDKFCVRKISFVQLSQFSCLFICNQSSVLPQDSPAYCSCRVTDQLIQHYETSFSLDRDYRALCRRTACPTYTTAGGRSGMATTTMHTMGMVMLVAAPVGIHAGVQIMTPTSERYWHSSMYLLQCNTLSCCCATGCICQWTVNVSSHLSTRHIGFKVQVVSLGYCP